MSPRAAKMSEADMARATLLRVVLASVSVLALYFSLMAVAVWEGTDVYAIFLPLVILVLGMLASSLAKLGLRGRYAEPLSRSMLAVGITASFLALIFEGIGLDQVRLAAAAVCAIATLACSLLCLVSRPGRRRIVLRAITFILAGATGLVAAGLSNAGPVQALGPVMLTSAVVAAFVSLFPLVSSSRAKILRTIARTTESTSNVASIGAIVFLVVSYIGVIRPLVGSEFPQALSIVEWSMLLVGVAIIAWSGYRYLKGASGRLELRDWKVLGGEVRRDKAELEPASEAIKEFVQEGRKEGLLLLVASVLEKDSVDAETSKNVVSMILEYHETEPRLSTIRSERAREARAAEERRALVDGILDLCDAAAKARSIDSGQSVSSRDPSSGGVGIGDQ